MARDAGSAGAEPAGRVPAGSVPTGTVPTAAVPVGAVGTVAGVTADRLRGKHGQPWVYALLALGLVGVAGPFVWMLLGSVKPERELREAPPTWFPREFTLENYRQLFSRLDFPQFFFNSTLVAVAVTLGNLVVCSMLGYALAKLDFPGKRVLFLLVLGMLMVPYVVLLVTQFVLVSNLHMVNTYPGIILPMLAVLMPFGVFLMRQYISGLPDELIDAARVDGAGEFRIFATVVAPLTKPALAALGILTFLASWNNFLWPLVAAQTEERYTLPVALALYSVGQNRTQYGLLLAGSTVVVLPVLFVFLALQRHFVQGIAMTGLK
jgi:multiple sugar transport system permease protein